MCAQLVRQGCRIGGGLLWLVVLMALLSSCQRRQPVAVVPVTPVLPPPPNPLMIADESYEMGDYRTAIAAYSTYLRENPSGAAADRVLFRMGMAYALPSNPSQDMSQAVFYMNELRDRFPDSPLRPEAELLVSLQLQIQKLRDDVDQEELLTSGFRRRLDQLDEQQVSTAEEFQGELSRKEDRIRQLSAELERLKAIDMQRRPTTPPQ
jgi:hypothetical protein